MGRPEERPQDMEVVPGTRPPSPEEMLGKPPTAALFNPCGVAVASDGRIYIADTGHHRVCVLEDGVLSVLAGSGVRGCADGKSRAAQSAHLGLPRPGTVP